MADQARIPDPTLIRLANVYRTLLDAKAEGLTYLNSLRLQERTGITAAQIRKDLSHLGEMGRPGVGYEVESLIDQVGNRLNLNKKKRFALIGAGRLGQALAAYPGLLDYSFQLAAVFDSDKRKIGRRVTNCKVERIETAPKRLKKLDIKIAVLTVPSASAQDAANLITEGGIKWILNFTPAHIRTPDDCLVRNVSFTHEFAVLAHFVEDKHAH